MAGGRRKSRTFATIFLSLLSAALLSHGLVHMLYCRRVMKFSVDDATLILQDIAANHYDSLFDSPCLNEFRRLHEEYNLDVTLFLFEHTEGFQLEDFPQDYREEFEANSSWLKLGWHGIDEDDPAQDGYNTEDLYQSFLRTTEEIRSFAGADCLSRELRIHYWYTDGPELVRLLAKQGIRGLYYPDSDVTGYDFTEAEDRKIRNRQDGVLYKRYGLRWIRYQTTDLRLDPVTSQQELEERLQELSGDRNLVTFTHAWTLDDTMQWLEPLCQWSAEHGYRMDWN